MNKGQQSPRLLQQIRWPGPRVMGNRRKQEEKHVVDAVREAQMKRGDGGLGLGASETWAR